jgi:heme A synthase
MAQAASMARHRFAVLTAAATWVLLFLGGLVTSTGSGLAVPDWPLSFGQVMPEMVGGVLFEHGHRMAASLVGFLTLILSSWTVVSEPRPGVRALGIAMIVAVILQGVLGGVTVLYKLPIAVSVTHACLAQTFFCLAVTMAIVTGPSWGAPRARPIHSRRPLPALAAATTAVIFVQLVLGALTRHSGAGLAIPTSRSRSAAWSRRSRRTSSRSTTRTASGACSSRHGAHARDHRGPPPRGDRVRSVGWRSSRSRFSSQQIALGASIIWTHRSVVPTTTHLVIGAALLATCWATTLRAGRSAVGRARDARSAARGAA